MNLALAIAIAAPVLFALWHKKHVDAQRTPVTISRATTDNSYAYTRPSMSTMTYGPARH